LSFLHFINEEDLTFTFALRRKNGSKRASWKWRIGLEVRLDWFRGTILDGKLLAQSMIAAFLV
jgi:hypothetical protein